MGYNIRKTMSRFCIKFAALALLCIEMCGCEAFRNFFQSEEDPVDMTEVVAYLPQGKPRIRPGVSLVVQVGASGVNTVEMESQVDQSGNLQLQYLLKEPVACNMLTLESLQQKLVKAYQRYIRQPQVTVRFSPNFDPRNGVSPYGVVNVMGQVQSPGPVNMPPTMDLTVTKAIQLAGGARQFADKSKVKVTRYDADGKRGQKIVNLEEIGKEGKIEKDLLLKPGDVVYVPEAWY